jgi:hypothetical protein
MYQVISEALAAVSTAGPVGWVALVAIAGMILAGFALYAIVRVVIALRGKR